MTEIEPEAQPPPPPDNIFDLAQVTNSSPTAVMRQARALNLPISADKPISPGQSKQIIAAIQQYERQGPVGGQWSQEQEG